MGVWDKYVYATALTFGCGVGGAINNGEVESVGVWYSVWGLGGGKRSAGLRMSFVIGYKRQIGVCVAKTKCGRPRRWDLIYPTGPVTHV